MTYPTPFTVGHHAYSDDGEDPRGNPVVTYTPPADQPGTAVPVYGWYVPTSTEPALAGHDRVIVDVAVLVPPGFPAGPRDLIDLPDGQCEVIGYPEDYTHNPFGWGPGGVLNLRRVEG